MKRHIPFIPIVAFVSLLLSQVFAQQIQQSSKNSSPPVLSGISSSTVKLSSLNINNLWIQINNDGRLGADSSGHGKVSYPAYQGNILYADHLFWVGQVNDGQQPVIRTGGGTYAQGVAVRPGSIVGKGSAEDPQSESVRVYRFRPDYITADLKVDAAALYGVSLDGVTPDMLETVRENYKKDLADWPWKKGAPFVDRNSNGAMDTGELPGLQHASQIAWFAYNDLDVTACQLFAGDPPIGLEVQVTLWAYKNIPNLDDVVFKRYRLIYKGTSQSSPSASIDSMYICQWSDPDLGSGSDDLGGCDTTLDLAYAYNGTLSGSDQDRVYQSLGLSTPGFGYCLLQGPTVPSSGETAVFDFRPLTDFRNLPMTSCLIHMTGLGDGLNEVIGSRSYYYYNAARGFQSLYPNQTISWAPRLDYQNKPSRFMYSGDPVTRTGWIASKPSVFWYPPVNNPDFAGGDVRLYLNTGPFTMRLGETQEIVVAMIASAAPRSVENATWLKNRARFVRALYPNLGDYVAQFVTGVQDNSSLPSGFRLDQNYPNPFNPSTKITFSIPQAGTVRLSVFDLLGRETIVLFDGNLPTGAHSVMWNGRNAAGEEAPSGVYFYRVTYGDHQRSRKMVLLR